MLLRLASDYSSPRNEPVAIVVLGHHSRTDVLDAAVPLQVLEHLLMALLHQVRECFSTQKGQLDVEAIEYH